MTYYEINKNQMKIQQKQYRNNNKEYRNNQKKEYYQNNKQHILEYNSEIFNCTCGKTYTRRHKQRHLRTNYHLKNNLNILYK